MLQNLERVKGVKNITNKLLNNTYYSCMLKYNLCSKIQLFTIMHVLFHNLCTIDVILQFIFKENIETGLKVTCCLKYATFWRALSCIAYTTKFFNIYCNTRITRSQWLLFIIT